MTGDPIGRISGLLLRPASRAEPRLVEEARLTEEGLEGDHARAGKRAVTLMSLDGWEAAAQAAGRPELSWDTRRANVLVEDLALPCEPGTRLRLGDCLVEVTGPNPPCGLMEEAASGLEAALRVGSRAGVCARVCAGGRLRVGDSVRSGGDDSRV